MGDSRLENIAWSDVSRKPRRGEAQGRAEQPSLFDHQSDLPGII
jgi:hypothetical protein